MDEDGKFILDMDNPYPLIYQQMTYVGNLPGIWGFKLGIEAFLRGADYIFNAHSPHRIGKFGWSKHALSWGSRINPVRASCRSRKQQR